MSAQDTGGGAAAAVGTAKDEAQGIAHQAAESGQDLLHEMKDEAGGVAAEATQQARDLLGEARDGVRSQAADQQARAAQGLRSLGDELGRMAEASEGGLAQDLVRDVAGRTGAVASWLEDREPGDVLGEVADFARRRPGTFLALAAGAGVVVGRLARGLKDAPPSGAGSASRPAGGGPAGSDLPGSTTGLSTPSAGSAGGSPDSGSALPAAGTAAGDPGGQGAVPGGGAEGLAAGDGEPLHREPGPALGEERAWAQSGGEAPVAPTPGHLPTADDAGTAGGDPLAGAQREDQP
ncbi:hypothetical protein [Cellulomonas sp. C5510]|uniref:hypothetical protein n=1 Tax=Cellulomonas sp. C5510 TaxID=2871170 RepID=UPI001C973A69|nr:hypothetical protein [Cellulomonas sp. C5510]QZN84145.1 hypothetical protein K5O09_09515 [Cellulomonas sp. C5510]